VRQHHVVQADAAGDKAFRLGVVDAVDPAPCNSDMMFMWYQGGRKVFSATAHRSGKITKSMLAVPAVSDGEVEHREDRGIGMVEADGADRREGCAASYL